jgi:hypothetical protein
MMRRRIRTTLAMALLGGTALPHHSVGAQATPAAPAVAWAVVTYLSGATVYLEVGSRNGVREGTTFTVMRGGDSIAELSAKYVSSTRTACSITTSTTMPIVGDSVRFVPAPEPKATTVAAGGPTRTGPRPSPLRGRIGIRYLVLDQGDAGKLTQPALDLRLDGTQLGGTALGVAVDVRTQRTTQSGGTGTATVPDGQTRVYQAALTMQHGIGGTRWALGRQFATALSPIGIFDGAALDINGQKWSGGMLAGTQPDAATFAPSGTTTEYGLWLQRHGSAGQGAPWSATVGAIGSYDQGEINREFLYLRGTINSRHFSLYAAQEIDANRGWKQTLEGSFATFTSSFVTAQVNIGDALSLSGGLDSRRSVRLYRDFLNPEIVFDDAFRQGEWGEASLRISRHLRVSTDIRTNGGGTDGSSSAVTGAFYATQLTPLGLSLRARSTQYSGPLSEGTLTSVALEAAPRGALRLSINGGVRTSSIPGSGLAATRLTWAGGDLDLAIGRSWYLLLSTYRESGTSTASIQTYASLTWRF